MIKFRLAFGVVLFFLMAIAGTPISTCFAILGLFEIISVGVVMKPLISREEVVQDSLMGVLVTQYSDGLNIDPTEMLHMGGARVLAALLGFLAVWHFIPAIVVYLTTIVDIVPKQKQKKPRK
ncbi:MAG: hypothetical protein WC666_04185 [Candidatus Paceibacterota bacterium]|jgi:hypothetical protein